MTCIWNRFTGFSVKVKWTNGMVTGQKKKKRQMGVMEEKGRKKKGPVNIKLNLDFNPCG